MNKEIDEEIDRRLNNGMPVCDLCKHLKDGIHSDVCGECMWDSKFERKDDE